MPLSKLALGEERVPEGEIEDIKAVMRIMRAFMDRDYPAGTRPMRRNQHPKSHGCVRAEFIVEPDLPAELAQGLFATPGAYAAWVRFSSSAGAIGPDWKRDAHGMAVKVMGVPGEKILPAESAAETQDFLMIDSSAFFIRNCAEYLEFSNRFATGAILGFFFGLRPFRCRLRAMWNSLQVSQRALDNPLQAQYWSQTPFKFGETAAKFSARAQGSATIVPDKTKENYRREVMVQQLSAGEVVFDFLVQLQTDAERMPIEDSVVRWPEGVSPFRKVATIRIPRQQFDNPEQDEFAEHLSYTPWHALAEHQPLGALNRMRRVVYEKVQVLRHSANGVPGAEPEPGNMGGVELL